MLGAGVLVGDSQRCDLHHRVHPRHLEYIGLVPDCRHLPAVGTRGPDRCIEHSRHRHVDAEHRAAVALGRGIQSSHRLADQAKPVAVLQRRRGAQRQLGGIGGEPPVSQTLAARVDDEACLSPARRDIDLPALGGGANQHLARRGPRGAQALVERRGRHRGAFLLRRSLLPERDLVGRPAGHEPDLHARPIGVELIGEDLRQRGVRPLPDLRLRQAEGDLPVRGDQDPIRDLVVAVALGAGRTDGDRYQQGCAGQRRSSEDKAARHWRHHDSSDGSPPVTRPRHNVTKPLYQQGFRCPMGAVGGNASGGRPFWPNEPKLQKRNSG